MHPLSAILIAAVSNLDNLSVGVALGMRARPVTLAPNAIIAAVTMAATAAALTSGRAIAGLLPSTIASDFGAAIIIALGVLTLTAARRTPHRPVATAAGPSVRADRRCKPTVSPREALVLGVGLSLNNIGSGVGAGIAGVSPLATTLLAGLFSLLAVGGGSRLGWSFGRLLFADRAQLVAGVLLVGVGAAMLAGAL
jgi:putative Mn2+ efflux pump MntP